MQQHEKTSLRYVFFRLYSNDELLAFLKEQLKNGLVLDHCKGNFFFFRRWNLKNARLCVMSIPCSKLRAEDDDEVQEYLDIAKRKGWQLLCVGDYESLLPMRRRLYFYTCDDQAQPLEQDEAADFQNASAPSLFWQPFGMHMASEKKLKPSSGKLKARSGFSSTIVR